MSGISQIADSIIAVDSIIAAAGKLPDPSGSAQKPFVIAIDGPCASGKSTLARQLQLRLGCPVIKMDHFFLPAELRTPSRLAQEGGNIHYERFEAEVLNGLVTGQQFNYRIFDCSSMTYSNTITVLSSPIVIIEGSYSLHPKWRSQIDLAIFLRAGKEDQEQRILERSSLDVLKDFQHKWIPLENRYFSKFKICESADMVFISD